MAAFPRGEVQKTIDALHSVRDKASAGEMSWDALAELFTADAAYIDPAWGRLKGRNSIRQFLRDSMQGLEGWTFPTDWCVIEGNRVVSKFRNHLPGRRPDGTYYEVPGVSVLEYAGDSKFSFEVDIINMVHLYEALQESGWIPGPNLKVPEKVVRQAEASEKGPVGQAGRRLNGPSCESGNRSGRDAALRRSRLLPHYLTG